MEFLINAPHQNGYFILQYHLFLRKKFFFFDCLYFSEYDIRMFLFILWLINKLSIKYVRNYGNRGSHPIYVQVRTEGEGYHASCVLCTYTISFHVFVLCCLVFFHVFVLCCLVLFVEV